MAVNFRQRADALARQLAQVERDLPDATDATQRRLLALRASLRRSLRWYQSRAGSRSDIYALRAEVNDTVHTAEARV